MILIILAVIVILAAYAVIMYNGLIKLKVRVDEAWSDIDVQLKRRYDLIPNLINTVKGYAAHESGLLERLTEARTKAMGAQGADEKAEAENTLSGTLKSLFAVAENYPDLKANQNFLELQRELTDTEDKIQAARRFYNANVRDLNTKTQVFPDSIIAGFAGIKQRVFFELDDPVEKTVPQVEF